MDELSDVSRPLRRSVAARRVSRFFSLFERAPLGFDCSVNDEPSHKAESDSPTAAVAQVSDTTMAAIAFMWRCPVNGRSEYKHRTAAGE